MTLVRVYERFLKDLSADSEKPGLKALYFKACLFLSPEGRGHTPTQTGPTEPYLVIHHTVSLLSAAEMPENVLAKHPQTQIKFSLKPQNSSSFLKMFVQLMRQQGEGLCQGKRGRLRESRVLFLSYSC